jgi:hypothetical protein
MPPTTSGVQNEQGKAKQKAYRYLAKHSETIYLSIMCQWNTTPAKQSTEKAPRQSSLPACQSPRT